MQSTKNRFRTLGQSKGFTLVEIMVTVGITALVSLIVYSYFAATNRSLVNQNVTANTQQDVRAAVDLLVQDIRLAGLDPTVSHNFGIESADANTIRFTSDSIDPGTGQYNGEVDDYATERMTYTLQGGQLLQILFEGSLNENTVSLVDNVQNFTLTYYDKDNVSLGGAVSPDDVENIRVIEVALTVEKSSGLSAPVMRTLIKKIKCRNLAFN